MKEKKIPVWAVTDASGSVHTFTPLLNDGPKVLCLLSTYSTQSREPHKSAFTGHSLQGSK